jgi:hypothetical protein
VISAGSLVRTRAHRWDMPIGGIYLVITGTYEREGMTRPRVIDILFKGAPRTIDIHNVEKVE